MMTDVIILFFLIYFFVSGWRKGLTRTLTGSLSFIGGFLLAVIYFKQSKNPLFTAVIAIFAPLILGILLSLLITFWNKIVDKGVPASLPSRCLGSIVSLLWGTGIIALSLILISVLPKNFYGISKIQASIADSYLYMMMNEALGKQTQTIEKIKKAFNALTDPERFEDVKSLEEFKILQEDEKVQGILADEDTLNELQNKDYPKLMTNPKVLELMEDTNVMEKFMDLNLKLMEKDVNP